MEVAKQSWTIQINHEQFIQNGKNLKWNFERGKN